MFMLCCMSYYVNSVLPLFALCSSGTIQSSTWNIEYYPSPCIRLFVLKDCLAVYKIAVCDTLQCNDGSQST